MKICLYRLNTIKMCTCHCGGGAKWQRVLMACENLRLLCWVNGLRLRGACEMVWLKVEAVSVKVVR
jgi:hypothetical protein